MSDERLVATVRQLEDDPQNTQLLVLAGDLAEELGRKPEAWLYWRRAAEADCSLKLLVPRLRRAAENADQLREVERFEKIPGTFREALKGLWKYPVTGAGMPTLMAGAIFFFLFQFFAATMPGVAILSLILTPYLFIFYINVVRASAFGSDDVPHWPDIQGIFRLIGAQVQFVLGGFAAFWPAIVAVGWLAHLHAPRYAYAGVALLAIVGAVFVPMCFLANCVFDRYTASFRYLMITRAIRATWKDYRLCVPVVAACWGLAMLGVRLAQDEGLLLAAGPALVFLELYGFTLAMRVVGLLYRYHHRTLRWIE